MLLYLFEQRQGSFLRVEHIQRHQMRELYEIQRVLHHRLNLNPLHNRK